MSKVDAQRAMREAKYARNRASGPNRREAVAAAGTAVSPGPSSPSSTPALAAAAAAPEGERCGHKSMNGRACTRAAGDAEKSHRYS